MEKSDGILRIDGKIYIRTHSSLYFPLCYLTSTFTKHHSTVTFLLLSFPFPFPSPIPPTPSPTPTPTSFPYPIPPLCSKKISSRFCFPSNVQPPEFSRSRMGVLMQLFGWGVGLARPSPENGKEAREEGRRKKKGKRKKDCQKRPGSLSRNLRARKKELKKEIKSNKTQCSKKEFQAKSVLTSQPPPTPSQQQHANSHSASHPPHVSTPPSPCSSRASSTPEA